MPRKGGLEFDVTTNVPLESWGQRRDLHPCFASTRLTIPAGDPLVLQAGVSPGTERVKLTHDPQDPEKLSFCATYVDGL